MTEETAKALIDALNRCAAVLEKLQTLGGLGGGFHVYHHGLQPQQPYYQPSPYYPWTVSNIGTTGGLNQ